MEVVDASSINFRFYFYSVYNLIPLNVNPILRRENTMK
jgi:hypothetical protein